MHRPGNTGKVLADTDLVDVKSYTRKTGVRHDRIDTYLRIASVTQTPL